MKKYLSHYICLFLTEYLSFEKGLSENTIFAYRDCLKLFLQFVSKSSESKIDTFTCEMLDNILVVKFLDWLEVERKSSPKTRNARLAALKSFVYYLGRSIPEYLESARKIMLISKKKVPHKPATYLEVDEIKEVINSVSTHLNNGFRDKALLLFMYNTGGRVQEIADTSLDDLRLDSSPSVKITGKGKKQRTCPLWEETANAINDYLKIRSPMVKDEVHLFLNTYGNAITRFGINYILKKYVVKAAEIKSPLMKKIVSPHVVRHTTAMHLLQSGNELNMVRLWLGHASLNTTHMYIEIDMKMKRDILSKCNPPELSNEKKKWHTPKILQWLEDLSRIEHTKLC